MRTLRPSVAALLLATITACPCVVHASGTASQESLQPLLNVGDKKLQFDWPMLRIGTGEYAEGPTGVTVFRFGRKVMGAVDVRGGGPGTVNTDFLRLGYNYPDLDTVVFSGGSWYGLEATTAAATALKDDGERGGHWDNVALSVGAIIYDFGDRRLNEIYPDKKLAQAALRAAQPGVFPLGAQGAGRSARSGQFFGCNAHSGQGGAFRQVGPVKIAAFTVVNAFGVVTDRNGHVVACNPGEGWPKPLRPTDLLAGMPDSRKPGWQPSKEAGKNTTVSLVVVNQTLEPALLQRIAVQVHTAMARGIQPFATEYDGDVLYAVSTGELDEKDPGALTSVDLGVIASEVMWDAILSSVPEQPRALQPNKRFKVAAADLAKYQGEYRFSELVSVRISEQAGKLVAQATGARDAFAIKKPAPVELLPVAQGEFMVPGRYPLNLRFADDRLTLNPGHWQQIGAKAAQ
ncbi:P1 family peptidase [Steroidobacter sp. S1-65]|uniref:P1 family peptidase n=1 Tax=Steroidobacter gossypii TaxID=2805490 RepID=A0ABS1X1T5_9GAMM|nr:P1 family peptidase [Steroidobacter gossypii]MBM0107186.1 P1 family peptidase [Steroidobacter gossypii]